MTKRGVVDDAVYESPVDRHEARWRRKLLLAVVVLALLALVVCLGYRFLSDRPVDYRSAEDHFKYGSIGSESGGSIFSVVGGTLPPYPIFAALPRICPDALPKLTNMPSVLRQSSDAGNVALPTPS